MNKEGDQPDPADLHEEVKVSDLHILLPFALATTLNQDHGQAESFVYPSLSAYQISLDHLKHLLDLLLQLGCSQPLQVMTHLLDLV